MTCIVVNLRKAPYDVYIGRAGRGHSGYFGNPFVVGRICARCSALHEDGGSTLACYAAHFTERVQGDSEFLARVLLLRGKRLGCFCKPAECHGDVIAHFVNQYFGDA